jgi:integrase
MLDARAGAPCRVSQVIVEGIIKRTGKTDGALRTIALPDTALDVLTAMPRPLDGSELVFKAPKGGPISLRNFRRRAWYKALADAGLERRPPYQCRHTFATLALAAGADVCSVSRQRGHTDIGTTLKRYARFVPNVQERNLGLLNGYFQATPASESVESDEAQ